MNLDQRRDNELTADWPCQGLASSKGANDVSSHLEAFIGSQEPESESKLPLLDGTPRESVISFASRGSSADLWMRLSALFASGIEPSSLMNAAVQLVGRGLGDACAIVLTRGEGGGVVEGPSWTDHPELGRQFAGLLAHYCLGAAGAGAMELIASGRPIFVPSIGAATQSELGRGAAVFSCFRSLVVAPMRANRRLLGALCLATLSRDLSEQVRDLAVMVAEQLAAAVEESRQRLATDERYRRLQALIDAMPAGLMVADVTPSKPLLINEAGRTVLGCPEGKSLTLGELRSRIRLERIDGDNVLSIELPIVRSLELGELSLGEELIAVRTDGQRIPVLCSSVPLRDAVGQVVAAVTIFQDITRLKQADRMRKDLLSRVAHEFKTPITAIKGAAAVALNSPRPLHRDEIGELLRIVDEQADRLRGLVNDILQLSRIQEGLLRMQVVPTVLSQVLQTATERFRLAGWRHTVNVDVDTDLPLVLVDPQRLCEALDHVLQSVARIARPSDLVYISARQREAEIVVRVAADEQGAPAPQLGEAPDSPPSADDSEIIHADETAVGLAIAKGIIKAHGGRLSTELDNSGRSVRFALTLPVVQEVQQSSAFPASQSRARSKDQRQRVLVVDDAARTAELMRRSLENAGYHAVATGDSESVLGLVELEQPDLVILDLMLPHASGFEILRQLREFSKTPVIIVSVKEDEEDKVRGFELGADDYVTKPFGLSEFLARVRAVLRRCAVSEETIPKLPFVLDDLVIDFTRRKVTVAECEARLSPTEYKLLHQLATHAGQVLTHDQLLERVWGKEYAGAHDLVRSFVRSLRKKLGDGARAPRYVMTEQGVGYYVREQSA